MKQFGTDGPPRFDLKLLTSSSRARENSKGASTGGGSHAQQRGEVQSAGVKSDVSKEVNSKIGGSKQPNTKGGSKESYPKGGSKEPSTKGGGKEPHSSGARKEPNTKGGGNKGGSKTGNPGKVEEVRERNTKGGSKGRSKTGNPGKVEEVREPSIQVGSIQKDTLSSEITSTWVCSECTYSHTGSEVHYLACKVCSTMKSDVNKDVKNFKGGKQGKKQGQRHDHVLPGRKSVCPLETMGVLKTALQPQNFTSPPPPPPPPPSVSSSKGTKQHGQKKGRGGVGRGNDAGRGRGAYAGSAYPPAPPSVSFSTLSSDSKPFVPGNR